MASSSSSSSSSSACCSLLYCNGTSCSYFSSWYLSGLSQYNSDNCTLYVLLEITANYQQVSLYKDSILSDLVASGQRLVFLGAGGILLSEENGSGLSGSVSWAGTMISDSSIVIGCSPFSSSSSLTSLGSTSTSSLSTASTSSSTSICCANPSCLGTSCTHFSGWTFAGSSKGNTDNCVTYVLFVFDSISVQQQIKVYKNSSMAYAYLVAEGQGTVGVISLAQRNSSGLTGSVTWDGVPVAYPLYVILDCEFSSSSSESSFSSSSLSSFSTSSVSSESSSSSTISSLSSFSSSSTSRSSSSSSSSINSFSSSSESIGNVSTSSSSSIGGWNKTKPLILGMSAINASGIVNRLAQTISIIGDSYDIGKVFCYFYGPFGTDNSYTIHLDVYTCNDSGEPLNILASQTIAGTSITGNGWYSFTINISGETPSNKYLSFVVWQENGNEDDYILWGHYYTTTTTGTKALFSNNGSTWQYQEDVIRSLKLIGNFSAYDLDEFRILTPPAERECTVQNLLGGENDGTKFVPGSYQYSPDKVVIDYPEFISSFVVDSSGSMGWNDRLSRRQEFIQDFIQRFKQKYPNNVLFDIVKFGAQVIDSNSIYSSMGSASSILVDLSSPTRTEYSFTVSSANASKNDIYTNNSYSFVVSQTITDGTTLICSGLGDSDIFSGGTLTKTSGGGDPTITYSSYLVASVSNLVVAYGFKNFEEDHFCNLSGITIGGVSYDVGLTNWQSLTSGGEVPLALGNNGPFQTNASSIDFVSNATMTLRRTPVVEQLLTTKVISSAYVGDFVIIVENSSIFNIGDQVDFIDEELASLGHTITNTSSISLTITPPLVFDISSWNSGGGIAQQSNLSNAIGINGTSANIELRDAGTTRNITFFLQTVNGLSIEWDIQPFKEWYIHNLYWLDETAVLPISIFDTDGNPFPDGTKIVFYVNNYPSDSTADNQVSSINIVKNALIGSTKMYLLSTEEFIVGQDLDVLNNSGNVQTIAITEIDEDSGGHYIIFDPALQYNFTVANHSRVVPSVTAQDSANASSEICQANRLSSGLSLIDATPIYTGKSLDPSLLKPYDPTPVDPSTTYSQLNLDQDRIRFSIQDIPSIDGYGVIRILPITEDNLKTINEKDQESTRLIRATSPNIFTDQLEQNQGDSEDVSNNFTTTTTTVVSLSMGEDYTIDNPVYLYSGYAQSSMTTFAIELEEKEFEGIFVPGVDSSLSTMLLVKQYKIYPSIIAESGDNKVVAKQYLNSFEVYFTPPINIYSNCISQTVSFNTLYETENCPGSWGYTTKYVDGTYATDDGFRIDYVITDKQVFPSTGQLKIRIYSNTIIDLSQFAASMGSTENPPPPITRQDLSVDLPKTSSVVDSKTVISQPLTDIQSWRKAVEENPASQALEDSESNRTPTSDISRDTIVGVARITLENAGYVDTSSQSAGTTSTFEYYTKPWEWTKATQYGTLQEITLDIVDGKASLVIPSSDISALLLIQASVYFGDNDRFEFIRSDLVTVANPIDIGAISPQKIYAQGGFVKYEIEAFVTWIGLPIADNVLISFKPKNTPCLPSVSKTDKGWSGGVYLGPHDSVTMTCKPDLCDECCGEFEDVEITVSYLGYSRTVIRRIEWTGRNLSEEGEMDSSEFYFYVNGTGGASWADGTSEFSMTIDLDDVENALWIEEFPYIDYPLDDFNRARLKGYQQNPNDQPNLIRVGASGLQTNQSQTSFISDVTYINIFGLNSNIGNVPGKDCDRGPSEVNPYREYPPYASKVSCWTGFGYYDQHGEWKTKIGTGVAAYPYYTIDPITGDNILITPYPLVKFSEPLGISLSLESYNGEFIRDGVASPNIIAEVTWKGQPITSKFTKNAGKLDETIIDFPFPDVTFEAGTKGTSNMISRTDSADPICVIDHRGTENDSVSINSNQYVSLSSYSTVVSLSRTDIYSHSVTGRHTHSCTVDSYGSGITETTIILEGDGISDHVHTIVNYVALSSGIPAHQHNLRSVAITKLNPLVNPNVNIAINGYVVYDPTNCQPYSWSDTSNPTPLSSTFTNGNRMMFNTLYVDSKVLDRKLILSMTADNGYTTENVTDTNKGINIIVHAKFSEYSVEDYPGHWVIIPESPIQDGTRFVFDIACFMPVPASQSSDLLVIRPDAIRKYMFIKVIAIVYADELQESIEKVLTISSNLQWMPFVSGLVFEPTSDSLYLSQAITKIKTVGASQIHDAVKMAAQRIIQFQTDNSSWKNAKKAIFLLTDGDENTSEYSISQAIENVNFIDGKCEVPVIPVRLGYSYGSDDIILGRYSLYTCGSVFYMINASTSDIHSIIDDIITSKSIGINNGTYTNTIDLLKDNLATSISVDSLLVPTGSRVLFRARFSSNNYTWTDWTEWFDSLVVKDFSLDLKFKGRYFQYQIHLYGNDGFESPELYAGLNLCYYSVQTFTTFFQPVDLNINTDEYLASIHITNQATIPSTSSISYGYAQLDSTNIDDYSSVTRPLITPDRHTIILSRYNELFLTDNYQKYTAINGGWPENAQVEVYRVNNAVSTGELVSSTEYAINNKNGTITFYNGQSKDDKFVLCIYFDPVFRIVCNVTNYGPDPVIIDGIGILYNTTKRIPTTQNGNITHMPISERIS